MYFKERFQNNYDFLRLFAALCIIFSHSFALLNKIREEPFIRLSNGRINFSFIGLSVFFCISGYLIAKSATRSSSLKNYLWKRVLRIQPLLIVTCILTVFLVGPFFTDLLAGEYFFNGNTWSYFRNIMPVFGIQFTLPGVFAHNVAENGVNGSLWTLIVEERLYIVMCVVFLLKKNRNRFFEFILLLNLFYLFNRFFYNGDLVPYLTGTPFFYSLLFLNSAALYLLNINFSKSLLWFIFSSTAGFLIAIIFPALDFIYFFSIPVLINSVAKIKGITNYAGKYGDFTYAVYVFSFPVQQIFIATELVKQNPYKLFVYTIITVFPLAVVSWHLVEKRFLRLKKLIK